MCINVRLLIINKEWQKFIAIFLTVVSVLACLTCFAGCTDEGMLKTKQAFCNHKWKEERRVAGTCKFHYNVITYGCSRCQKEKKEEVALTMQEISLLHDWRVSRTIRAEDCQHQDWTMKQCTVCELEQIDELGAYGPHADYDGDGKCNICGSSIN